MKSNLHTFFIFVLMLLSSVSASAVSINNTASGVQITTADGWNESLYAEWSALDGYTSFNVYVKGGQYSDYTKIDGQLVRTYKTCYRADALGLKAGSYAIKVVPVVNGTEDASKASEATDITVAAYNRDGYAHNNATQGVGAYNNDGTLKSDARVLYITKNNAKTVTLSMCVDTSKGKYETRTGVQDILQAYEKGQETRPLAIRFIGLLEKDDMPELGSSEEGLQIKGKGQKMNLTIEGVGNDATFRGFGMLARACQYVEIRNIGIMICMDDCISLDTDNEHVWVHNNDVFYGQAGSGDHAKGDGAIDVKGTMYCTVSGNHFWDTGKSTLNSNGDEVDYVTYHHNWYDHSDSRHPRVRKSQHLHVFNNYYDGNSKYGVGATTGSCIFVEANYFRNCKFPVLISMQGSDLYAGGTTSSVNNATFSKEAGGMIKTYNNYITGTTTTYIPYGATTALVKGSQQSVSYMDTKQHFDCYEVSERTATVPSDVVALSGGTGYNNFDTASDFYTYTPDAPADVPAKVTGSYGAGRCQHGDFKYTFNNATDDTNSERNTVLSAALTSYTTQFVAIVGDTTVTPGPTPTPDPDPTPSVKADYVYDWAAGIGSTSLTTAGTDGGVKTSTVKINKNTTSVNCIYFGKSMTFDATTSKVSDYYATITPKTESDGFKAGDTLVIAGAYNNTAEKVARIKVLDANSDSIYTTSNFINGRLVEDQPVIEKYVLTANTTSLILGRLGATGTNITTLQVIRPASSSAIQYVTTESATNPERAIKYLRNGKLIIVKNSKQYNAVGAQIAQ